jgi:hypothetical protein
MAQIFPFAEKSSFMPPKSSNHPTILPVLIKPITYHYQEHALLGTPSTELSPPHEPLVRLRVIVNLIVFVMLMPLLQAPLLQVLQKQQLAVLLL